MSLSFLFDVLIDFLFIFIPVSILYFAGKNVLKELGLYSNGIITDTKNIITIFLVLFVFSFIISIFASFMQVNDLELVATQIKEIQTQAPLYFAYLLIIRVISEEIFFRGFLVKKIGWIGSSFVFGLAHIFYGSIIEVVGAIVLGGILAKAYQQYKNLIPNIIAHFIYNVIFLVVFL